MGKIRVHELAKKLNMPNQDLMAKLSQKGIAVKSHSSSIDEASAMAALNSSDVGSANTGAKSPRTVLRRRRSDEPAQETSAPEPEEVVKIEPAPLLSESVMAAQAPEPELPAAPAPVSPLERETPTTQAPVSQAPSAQPQAVVVAPATVVSAPQAAAPAPHKNVIRVIDPNAIKARLASEGRTFKPRTPRPQGGPGGAGPRPQFTGVRDIRVVHDHQAGGAPQMIDVTGQKTASPRTAKKRAKDDVMNAQERREMRGGGYELWMQPGKKKKGQKKGKGPQLTQAAAHKRVVELSGPITVNDLAHQMSVKAGQVVAKLMGMGMMVTVNQPIDTDTASIIAQEFDYEIKNVAFEETDLLKSVPDLPEQMASRPPVVTVMGHVDHGKTSVLDAIRNTRVTASEAGGITQHIGAYTVHTKKGMVTFLDTPGHEAFTAMRARGAQVTDIVVLVVAADDGVMPQTIEAIDHAKAAKVPMVVAINKMDVPNAKPERVMQQLADHGVVSEEWGGDVQTFKVSALKGQGLDTLLDGLAMQAEIMELKANPSKSASGVVVEAKLDKGRGPVATVLTQEGTLRQGDSIVAGEHFGRVRAMYDSRGERLDEAPPSTAVQILGLSGVPVAGDKFNAVQDDKMAKTIADHRAFKVREQELMKSSRVTLENFLQSSPKDKVLELRLIVKADVYGSVEALVDALKGLTTRQVKVEIVHSGVGTITENDVNLAVASGAIIIGFNTKPDAKAHTLAGQEKVDVRSYSVIYAMLDEVRAAMAGLLAPVIEEVYMGKAEVRQVIQVARLGKIAGCYVTDGKLTRSCKVRVRRGKEMLFEGSISSLKRFKDDVREVSLGYECGVGVDGFNDLQEGDILECFETKQVAAKLDEAISATKKKAVDSASSSPA